MKRYIIIPLMAAAMMTSCNDVDIDLFDSPVVEEGSGSLTTTNTTVSCLSFAWQAVAGVQQYGYTLLDNNGRQVRAGVTSKTSIVFDNLEPDTRYTLIVEAFGANGEVTHRFKLEASTPKIYILATPDASEMTMTNAMGSVVITWPAVDNAGYYAYEVYASDGTLVASGDVEDNQVTLTALELGDYSITVQALSDEEGYLPSEVATFEFTRKRELWKTVDAVYTSHAYGENTRKLKIYTDGSYVLEAFMGVANYNLNFTRTGEETVKFTNPYYTSGVFSYFSTGLNDDYALTIYDDPEYCTFEELGDGGCLVEFFTYTMTDVDGDFDAIEWTE